MPNEVKWIKIVTDIFDDEKILLIESLPEADSIIVIWFKLLCLAGKQNNSGVFVLNNGIAYTDKMFATIFRRKESTVSLALKTFQDFGMVEIINNAVTIPNWGKHQTLDRIEQKNAYMRDYMREYRSKQKALTESKAKCKTNSKANVSEADIEVDKETELDNIYSSELQAASEPNEAEIAVISIPLNDGTEYGIAQSDVDEWTSLYPAVDIIQELREIRGWNLSNPNKRKTARGIKKHINNWLAREQDKGGSKSVPKNTYTYDNLQLGG